MKSFRHAGKFGDIIYSLPVIRYNGGGVLFIECGAPYISPPLTWEGVQALAPLLKAQPYIEDVREWKGEKCDVNLNDMRALAFREIKTNYSNASRVGLWQWYSKAFGVPETEWLKPWLSVGSPWSNRIGVVAHRCQRYTNAHFPWRKVMDKYRPEIIGSQDEARALGDLGAYRGTPSLFAAAQRIQGAKLFVGNQSVGYAIAEALKVPSVLEIWHNWPNCIFNRPYLWHGWDENVHLPNLEELP